MAVLQIEPASAAPLAYVGTFLLALCFYALTAHLAARFVLGDVAVQRALAVGAVPAFLSLLLQQFGPAVVVPATLTGDFLAIKYVYGETYRTTAVVTVAHYTVAVLLGISLYNLWRLVGGTPA